MFCCPIRKMFKTLRFDQNWWKRNVIYQIYPRSFCDSNGDGVGDLQGILQKLDYFEWLGIKVLWLSPIYQSPMADFGYDISDYRKIDALFGDSDDFKQLITEMHKRGMYLIMDLVPNHTSDQHEWFQSSVNKIEPFTDYYIWQNGKVNPENGDMSPPNNWNSCFGGPAWTWCEKRQQYYMHSFLKEQPDLNYRNKLVKKEMENVITFWMDQGVDGFRVDAIAFLMKHENFKDNVGQERNNHDQPETYDVVKQWVNLARSYGRKHKKYIFLVTEAYSKPEFVYKYYKVGVDFPFNFSLIGWNSNTESGILKMLIKKWLMGMPSGCWPNWVIGNHDQKRIATKLGGNKWTDVANMLLLCLPGTPTCYCGDELGMTDVDVTFEECQDPYGKNLGSKDYVTKSRDPCRSPMIWNCAKNAGFTSAKKPWLPITKEFEKICVENQQKDNISHLSIFKQLLQLRELPSFSSVGNNLTFLSPNDSDSGKSEILAFVRSYKKFDSYLIVLNVGQSGKDAAEKVDLSTERWDTGKIMIKSRNIMDESYTIASDITLKEISLKSAQGMVLRLIEKEGVRKRHHSNDEDEGQGSNDQKRRNRKRLLTE